MNRHLKLFLLPQNVLMALAIGALAGALALVAGYMIERHFAAERNIRDLTLNHELHRAAMSDHMNSVTSDLQALGNSPRVIQAFEDLRTSWLAMGLDAHRQLRDMYLSTRSETADRDTMTESTPQYEYRRAHAIIHSWASDLLVTFDYYDFFLISNDGWVFYSVEKEDDFATNLFDGPHAETPLGNAFVRAVRRSVPVISDVEMYAPSNGLPALFAAQRIVDAAGEPLGVLAIQLKLDAFSDFIQPTSTMGETGESYIVDNNLLMITQSPRTTENTVLEIQAENLAIIDATGGFSGAVEYRNFRGEEVVAIYSPFDIGGAVWAMVTEMSTTEVNRVENWSTTKFYALMLGLLCSGIAMLHVARRRSQKLFT